MHPVSVRLDPETLKELDQAVDEGDFFSRSEFIGAAIHCALDDIEEHGEQALDQLHDTFEGDEGEDNDNPGSDEEE